MQPKYEIIIYPPTMQTANRKIKAVRAKALRQVSTRRLKKLEREWRKTALFFFTKDEDGFHHRAEIFQHCANELRNHLS